MLLERLGDLGVDQERLDDPERGQEPEPPGEHRGEERARAGVARGHPQQSRVEQRRLGGPHQPGGDGPGDLAGLPGPAETEGRVLLENGGESDLRGGQGEVGGGHPRVAHALPACERQAGVVVGGGAQRPEGRRDVGVRAVPGVLDGVEVREGGLGAATQDLVRGHQHPGPQVAGAEAPAVARRAGDRGPGVGAGPRPVPAQGPREAQGALGLHRQVRPVVALGQGQRLGGVAARLVGLAVHQPAGARHERQGPQRGALHDLRPDRPGGGPHVVRASPREGGPDGHGPPEDGDVVALVAGRPGPGGGDELVGPAEVAVLEGREAQEETDPGIGGGPDQLLGARQGGELPASEELDGAGPDQELGGVDVAREARAPEGLDVVAAGVVPRGRPPVELAEVVRPAPAAAGRACGTSAARARGSTRDADRWRSPSPCSSRARPGRRRRRRSR